MRAWLIEHGADPHRLDGLAQAGVTPDVRVNCYPAFSTLRFDAAGEPVPGGRAVT